VDEDGGGQPFEDVDVGPGQCRHEDLHERRGGLVDQPTRLGRDRVEHQGALARTRDAGEHGQPPLRDLDADVLEVVDARALNPDQVVLVRGLRRRGHLRLDGAPQLAAFLTSSVIRASALGVSSVTANATGHISPSSMRASGWKPSVEYRTLNFDFPWKKQMTLPSLAYAGIP